MTLESIYGMYIRKSSDESQVNPSLEHQQKTCLRYAETNGLIIHENLIFQENHTGTIIDRPELNRLRKLVRNQMIAGIIVFSSDRLSRNPTDADTLLRECFNNGVELHLTTHGLLENTPETWLIWGIEAQFNSYWHNKYINRFGSHNVPKHESERILVNCPAVISEEVWKEAQVILEQGRNRSPKNSKHYEYLVANRAQCRHCEYAILGKPSKNRNGAVHLRYQCTMRETRMWQNFLGRKCELPTITARWVDDAVRNWLISLLDNPRSILASYQEAQKVVDGQLEEALETIRQYEEVITSYEDELKSYAELYVEKAITKAIFYEKKKLLAQKVADAKTHKLEYEDKLSERRITDKEITTAIRYAEMVRTKLSRNEEITFALLRKAIEDLDITFEFAAEDGHFVVYIYWAVYEYRLAVDRGETDQAMR